MKVLYVATEVAPFSDTTEAASLVRTLPEQLQERSGVESRIVMPRYGTVSERRNRLHEVIRLSGSPIAVGERTEVLKVKVASIPGIRLQVYFTDNNHYLKRKGIFRDRKTEQVFADNAERATFYARAAMTTAENLGWKPELVHAVGWMSGLVPLLLKEEFASHELFGSAKVVYTPDVSPAAVSLTAEEAAAWGIPNPEAVAGKDIRAVGVAHADAVVWAAGAAPADAEGLALTGEEGDVERVAALYEELVGAGSSA